MLVTTCLRVFTNSYELVTSIYEFLRFLAKKITHPAKPQCIRQQSVQNIVTTHLRILASSLRMVTCCCERLTILTDCYELFTGRSIRGQWLEDF